MTAAALVETIGMGVHDVPCPECGPTKRRPMSQRKPTLRVWRSEPGFASFHCVRCGDRGYVRDSNERRIINPEAIRRAQAEAAERERQAAIERLSTARWLWRERKPIGGSIAETYLREVRGYRGLLPATLGFLPARGDHSPAMIAAFGLASEPEPGVLKVTTVAIRGVHITRLAPDGSKAGSDTDKVMIGRSSGWPIVLAPPNDLLGLAIAEGIEDALSAHDATGLGAWAAGSAGRLPELADKVPRYIESVTIVADTDQAGQRGAQALAAALAARGIEIHLIGAENA